MVQHSFTSTETRRFVRTDSPGRPPRLSHSFWTMLQHTLSCCLTSTEAGWPIRDGFNTHGWPPFYIVSPTEPTQNWSPPGEISVGGDTKPCTDVTVTHPAGRGPRSIMLNLRVSRASALALCEPDSLSSLVCETPIISCASHPLTGRLVQHQKRSCDPPKLHRWFSTQGS